MIQFQEEDIYRITRILGEAKGLMKSLGGMLREDSSAQGAIHDFLQRCEEVSKMIHQHF